MINFLIDEVYIDMDEFKKIFQSDFSKEIIKLGDVASLYIKFLSDNFKDNRFELNGKILDSHEDIARVMIENEKSAINFITTRIFYFKRASRPGVSSLQEIDRFLKLSIVDKCKEIEMMGFLTNKNLCILFKEYKRLVKIQGDLL